MTIDTTRAGAKGRRPSFRGHAYARVSRGVEVFQKWPRARGNNLKQKTKDQMEYFRQVQWAWKFSSAWVQRSFTEAVHGTPLMPRDLFLMASSGRMHRVIDENGRSWWSVAAKKNVSDSLDVIAQLPGQMMFRGAELWRPIAAGTPGYILTYVSDIDAPEWQPGGSTAGTAWGDITGVLSDQLDLTAALTARGLLDGGNAWTGNQTFTGTVDVEGTFTLNGSPIAASAIWGNISGALADQTDLSDALNARLSVSYIAPDANDPRYMAAAGHGFGVRDSAGNGEAYLWIGPAGHGRVAGTNDAGNVFWDIGEYEDALGIHVVSSHALTFDILPKFGSSNFLTELDIPLIANWWTTFSPVAADFPTLVHSGAAIDLTLADDTNIGLTMDGGLMSGGDNMRFALKPSPVSDHNWSVEARLVPSIIWPQNFIGVALVLYETATTKSVMNMLLFVNGYNAVVRSQSSTGFMSNPISTPIWNGNYPMFVRIRYDAATTKFFFDISSDGKQWANMTSVLKSTLFTVQPDKLGLGLYMNNANAGLETRAACDYFVVNA